LKLRIVFALWLLLLTAAVLRLVAVPGALKSDLLSLLPPGSSSTLITRASEQLRAALEDHFVFALRGADGEAVIELAQHLHPLLSQSASVQMMGVDEQLDSFLHYAQSLKPYRHTLLHRDQYDWLSTASPEQITAAGLRQLYRPGDGAAFASLLEDPLGLYRGYLLAAGADADTLEQVGDIAVLRDSGSTYALLLGRVVPGAYHLQAQEALLALQARLEAELVSAKLDIELLRSGAVFHAGQAAITARQEVALIATGSALGIVLLFLLAFGSLRPLLLSLGSVLFGCLSATLFILAVFRELHLLTLVFGASLIGVSVDYALHYLTRAASAGPGGAVFEAPLKGLLPGLVLALITSLIGFGSLLQAPVPGLRQMAMFSMVGLGGAWLFVVVLFPKLAGQPRQAPAMLVRLAEWPERCLGSSRSRRVAALAVLVLAVAGLSQLQTQSDLRVFHDPDEALIAQQQTLEGLLPGSTPNQFFLVRGRDPQQVLERSESLFDELDALREEGVMRRYTTLADALPSRARQARSAQLLARGAYAADGPAESVLRAAGFAEDQVKAFRAEVASAQALGFQPWWAMASPALRQAYLGEIDGHHYALVLLGGVERLDSLQALGERHEWLRFVDTVAQLSDSLAQRQRSATLLLLVAYAVMPWP